LLIVETLPTISPPIVMVMALPASILAPEVVMTMLLVVLLVAAKEGDSRGRLQESRAVFNGDGASGRQLSRGSEGQCQFRTRLVQQEITGIDGD
jgi:hypothetical protein